MNDTPLLRIEDLSVQYMTDEDVVHAVNGLNVELYKGESLGFVGETGAGKTTAALSVIQLLPEPAGVITGGSIWYNGRNLIENKEKENVEMRGDGISMIFQDPMTALNPTLRISRQMMEVVESHRKVSRREAETICIDMLEKVGIKRDRFDDYPHQLSGGMKQRVVIAMALLCNPEILIADEPTTALDVTIQAQILEIIKNLIKESGMSMILITHDLGIVAETCNRIAVIYGTHIHAVCLPRFQNLMMTVWSSNPLKASRRTPFICRRDVHSIHVAAIARTSAGKRRPGCMGKPTRYGAISTFGR